MVSNNTLSDIKSRLIVIKLKNLYRDDPVDRLRGLNVVRALRKRGWNIHLFNNQKKIDLIIYLDDYNLYDRLVYEYIKAEKVVIDIQDNHLNRQNPAALYIRSRQKSSRAQRLFTELKKGFLPLFYKLIIKKAWYRLYIEAIKNADYLLCSSHALTESYKKLNPNVKTIPDALSPTPPADAAAKNERLSICWVGTENNIVYLKLVDKVIAELQEQYGTDFYIISSKNILTDQKLSGILESLECRYHFTEWHNETVNSELQKHHIAIAPLPEMSEKSTNKILTYMAAGVPVVASGAEDYKRLNREYPGSFLFLEENSPGLWIEALETLIRDKAKREALIDRAKSVVDEHTIDNIAKSYEQLFAEIFNESRR